VRGTIVTQPSLLIKDFTVTEGGEAIFIIGSSALITADNSIQLTLGDGTAKSPNDYLTSCLQISEDGVNFKPFSNGGKATIPIGKDCVYIKVQTVDDDISEPTETFVLNAVPVSGFSGGTVVETASILDNDPATTPPKPGTPTTPNGTVSLDSITDPTVVEGQKAVFTVELGGDLAGIKNVALTLSDDDAILGRDYKNEIEASFDNGGSWSKVNANNLAVAATVKQFQVRVDTIDNTLVDFDRVFNLRAAVDGDFYDATATIQDNDQVTGPPSNPVTPAPTPPTEPVTPAPTPPPNPVTPAPTPPTEPVTPAPTPPPNPVTPAPTPPTEPVTPAPTTPNANLTAKLVGDAALDEGGKAGNYHIQLNEVSSQDRLFTITIDDGTANRFDANKGTALGNATMRSFTGNGSSILEGQQIAKSFAQWGDVYWKTINTEPNGYQVTDNKDFTVLKSDGSLNKGNTITVKVAAGKTESDIFQVNAWKENVIAPWALSPEKLAANESFYNFYGQENNYIGTGRTSPDAKKVQEGNETFSLKVTDAGGVKVENDKLDVTIADKSNVLYISPISLDLNGDGIQTVSTEKGVFFDILNTGTAVNTGWISGSDAFLAFDQNHNGKIDNRDELFGGGVGEGFASLATFDSNGDGVVNANDERFNSLSLWKDSNVNGITDAGELAALDAFGIASLNVAHSNTFTEDANGNILGESSTAIRANGQAIEMTDVYFKLG
jgi:hypothetical protein